MKIYCGQCQTRLNVPDASAGKKTKCPQCGGAIRIPSLTPPKASLQQPKPPVAPQEVVEQLITEQSVSGMPSSLTISEETAFEIFGYFGPTLLFFGVFCPAMSIPIAGNMNYWSLQFHIPGLILIGLSIISFISISRNQYRYLKQTGLAILVGLVAHFAFLQWGITQAQEKIKKEGDGNPLGEVFEALAGTVQLQWGWGILFIGAGMMILTGFKLNKKQKA